MRTSPAVRACALPLIGALVVVSACSGSTEPASAPTVDLSLTSVAVVSTAEPETESANDPAPTTSPTASAEPVPSFSPEVSDNRQRAEALFAEGREAMKRSDFAVACKKFDASLKLDFGLGTLLNLAECTAKLGDLGRACALYDRAAAETRSRGDAREAVVMHNRAALGCKP